MNKTLIALLAFVGATGLASASQLPNTRTAKLETFDIDSSLTYLHNVIGGEVQLTRAPGLQEIKLTLLRKSNCPVGAMCIALVPAPVFVTLPIVGVTHDSEGNVVYTAKSDRRPMDGNLDIITLVDHGTFVTVAWNVRTSGMGGHVENYSSSFRGGALHYFDISGEAFNQAGQEEITSLITSN